MPRNVNLEKNLKFSLRIPRRTKDYRQDNQKINRNILVELKCYCLSMFPRRSILGVWNLNIFLCMPRITLFSGNFCRCSSEFVLKIPVHCSFRQKEVFPRMRAACNINYHYTLTISCLMWSLTVINPGITFDYLIEIWILWKYILLMLSCVICSFFHQEYSKYFLVNLVIISIELFMWKRITFAV